MSHLKDHVTNPNEGIPLFDERFKITRSIVDMLCRVCKNTLLRVDLVKDISKSLMSNLTEAFTCFYRHQLSIIISKSCSYAH